MTTNHKTAANLNSHGSVFVAGISVSISINKHFIFNLC